MTKIKQLDMTKRQIAKAWSCDESTVRARCDKLGIGELKNGKVDFHAANLAYIQHLEVASKKRENEIDPLAAARKLSAEADLIEAKAREANRQELIKKGELLYKSDVKQVWRERYTEMRSRCNEWLQQCMDIGNLKPMQREKKENEFVEYFNQLSNREY